MPEFVIHMRAVVEAKNAADAEDLVIPAMDDVPAEIYVDRVVTVRRDLSVTQLSGAQQTGEPR
jgi:hypothetical protein